MSTSPLRPADGSTVRGAALAARALAPSREALTAVPTVSGSTAWYNATAYMDGQPVGGANYSQYEAAAAYDPATAQVVEFGGCSAACPSNQTWAWNGNDWTNLTPKLTYSPPAVYGESMAWDPAYRAIILVGGILVNGSASNQTWAINATAGGYAWYNLTSYVGVSGFGLGTAFSSMAYDDALGAMLLVDGCVVASCANVWSYEWVLNATGWSAIGPGPGASVASSYLYGASMAYDQADREMVFFGGYSHTAATTVNFTYVLPENNTWTNLTSLSAMCTPTCTYPPDRYGASMTWDGQLDRIVLVGGYSDSAKGVVNDTWYFSRGTWSPMGAAGSLPGASAVYFGAMSVNSSEIAPVLLGGECSGACGNDSWVLEVPPQPEFVQVTPSLVEAYVPVMVTGTNVVGSGSGPTFFEEIYDNYTGFTFGRYPGNFSVTFDYSTDLSFPAGLWNITLYEMDFFGVPGQATDDITVLPGPSLTTQPVPSVTELVNGIAPVRFTSTPGGGSYPYTYDWSFGDGSGSALPNVTHDYQSSGTFDGWLNLTDSLGSFNNSTFSVTVYPELEGAAHANATATEVGASVRFTGTVAGGSGSYSKEVWQLGDNGGTWSGPDFSHAFDSAGTYVAYFNVTDSLGFTSSSEVTEVVDPALGAAAAANLTATDVGLSVGFTGTVTGGSGSYPTETWQFGSGGPTASGLTATHTFPAVGTYAVYLNVTDSLGFTTSSEILVVVNVALGGTAAASTTTPHVGDTVTFTGVALHGTGYDTYLWQFGDGSSASTATATHSYASTGSYTATLTITDAAGGRFVDHLAISVSSAPTFLSELTSGAGLYALTGVIVVVVAAAIVGLLLRHRGREAAKGAAPSGPSPPGGGLAPPPSSPGIPPSAGAPPKGS